MRFWGRFRRAGLLFGLTLGWAGCGDELPPPEPVVRPVKILELGASSSGQIREFPGEIQASQNADMAGEGSGKLGSIADIAGLLV